ncbi:MAG: glycosyl hydrolase 2 galactose-binding domain-containing protein [Opitutaceae bacterium]
MRHTSCLAFILLSFLPLLAAAQTLLLSGADWRLQNAAELDASPAEIIAADFDDSSWISASVPGTVLADYTAAGLVPDPLYGDNMHQIPDAYFSGNDYWYRLQVSLTDKLKDKRLYLDFSGVNWKADIHFNGRRLGRIDGAFMRGEFEITKWANFEGSNTLVVRIHHPEHWVPADRKVLRKSLGCRITNGDDHGYDSPASLAAAGWNWLPIMRGRNMGIWNHVAIHARGNVSIQDPWVESELPLPDTSAADLTIRTELRNDHSESVTGTLVAEFDQVRLEMPVALAANETRTIAFESEQFPALSVQDPDLWWPNGYGEPHLSKLKLTFLEGDTESDTETINFGIRQIDHKIIDDVLFLYCNGVRVLIRGGNWGLPEAMMRCDAAGYDLRVKLHQEANLNMIRNWVGMTNREELYDACDRYGMLIFDDFWLANPADGPVPLDQGMFMANAEDKIKWARKHPSLALYCGRNEGNPPAELDAAMRAAVIELDGTRHYESNSARGPLTGFGPYDVRHPSWYFQKRGKTFHTEQGIIAFPEVESMRAMMPAENLWPINDMWAIHNYQTGRSHKFTETIETRFGEPTSLEDYCRRAQLHNYESAKAMFDTLQSHQGSGVLLWMSQSAWPSLICQLYDHYFEYTASYFAAKKAASPIHILWDCERNEIRLANNTRDDRNLTATATIYDAKGEILWQKNGKFGASAISVQTCFPLEHTPATDTRFLKLELRDGSELIADNFYWLENSEANCLDLNQLPETQVSLKVLESQKVNGTTFVIIELENQSAAIALVNKVHVKASETNERILPVFFDDNYVSLLPGEKRQLKMRIPEQPVEGRPISLGLRGWNVAELSISID